MGIIEVFLVGVGLSMDAFAAALCKGLGMRKFLPRRASVIALFFGAFQAIMPLAGYFLGTRFAAAISRFDYLVAFGLLAVIGGKMVWDAFHEKDEEAECADRINWKELFLLAVATSIDALAVGVSFACLDVSIVPSALLIGATTFALSFLGVFIGNKFGAKYKSRAEFAGGCVLVLIGLKILLEHFGVL